MRRTNPIVLLAGLSVSVVRQVFARRVGAALALVALCLTMQAGTAGAALRPTGTLYVDQLLLDDCLDNCEPATGSRMLWRVSFVNGVPRLRALAGGPEPAPALWPAFSPQGDALVFADQQRHLRLAPVDLTRMLFAGSGVRVAGSPRLTGPTGGFPSPVNLIPAWSPDGTQIALAGQIRSRWGIWMVSRDGSGLRRLPCPCAPSGTSVDWSVGGQIAFSGPRARGAERTAVWLVDADGSGLRRATSPPRRMSDSSAKWSPDGRRLVYVRGDENGVSQLALLDVLTGATRTIARDAETPVWSPDGTQIAYVQHGALDFTDMSSSASLRIITDAGAPRGKVELPAYVRTFGFLDGLIWRPADDAADKAPPTALAVYASLPLGKWYGKEELRGVQLALADAGGAVDGRVVKLRSLRLTTPGRATGNAERAIRDPDTVGYIGEDDSDASEWSMPVLNASGIAQVSPDSNYSGLTRGDLTEIDTEPTEFMPSGTRTFARIVPGDFVNVEGVAVLAARRGARRVWLVDDDSESFPPAVRRLVRRRLSALGVRVAGHSVLTKRSQAIRIARRIRRSKVDGMIYTGYAFRAVAALWNQVHQLRPRLHLYGGRLDDPAFTRRISRGAARRTSLLLPEIPASALGPAAIGVARRFRAAYGHAPDFYALTAYESTSLLLDAIHRARPAPDRDSVRDALFATRGRSSIFGAYSISAAGDSTLSREAVYSIARDGELVFVRTLDVTR